MARLGVILLPLGHRRLVAPNQAGRIFLPDSIRYDETLPLKTGCSSERRRPFVCAAGLGRTPAAPVQKIEFATVSAPKNL